MSRTFIFFRNFPASFFQVLFEPAWSDQLHVGRTKIRKTWMIPEAIPPYIHKIDLAIDTRLQLIFITIEQILSSLVYVYLTIRQRARVVYRS